MYEYAYDKLCFYIGMEDFPFEGADNKNLTYCRMGGPYTKGWYNLANASKTCQAKISHYRDRNALGVEVNPIRFMNKGKSFRKSLTENDFSEMVRYLSKSIQFPTELVMAASVSRIDIKNISLALLSLIVSEIYSLSSNPH